MRAALVTSVGLELDCDPISLTLGVSLANSVAVGVEVGADLCLTVAP